MINEEKATKEQLLILLKGGSAHMTFDEAVKGYPIERINEIFPNGEYSAWHLLEHIRRAQYDILDFIINPNYEEMSWPKDYWPGKDEKAKRKDWEKTISSYHADLKKLEKIVLGPKTNFYEKIPWGDGQNIFREILLVADHTSYHIGEFAIMRQVMKTW